LTKEEIMGFKTYIQKPPFKMLTSVVLVFK